MCPKSDGGNTITANVTTAQGLAAYRDELVANNFHHSVIESLVNDAAHATVRGEGLRVKDPEPVSAEYQHGNGFVISEDRKVINYLGENYYAPFGLGDMIPGTEPAGGIERITAAVEAVEKLTGVSILETVEKLFGGPLYEDTWLTMQKFKRHNE